MGLYSEVFGALITGLTEHAQIGVTVRAAVRMCFMMIDHQLNRARPSSVLSSTPAPQAWQVYPLRSKMRDRCANEIRRVIV